MHDPGVEVRPLRQITGEAEFNEVFLTDARIPDSDRLGEVGEGWKVANATLSNERVAIGGHAFPREFGMVMNVAEDLARRAPSCARRRPTSGCCAAGSTPRSPGSRPPGCGRSWPPAYPDPRARR